MADLPIRILHVIGVMDRGGAEAMIMNLYRRIDRQRVQFDFVEHTQDRAAYDDEITALGGRIYRCPRYKAVSHAAYKKWWDDFFSAHGKEFAAVHGHIGSTAAIYLSAAKKHGLFTIAHSHNTDGPLSLKNTAYKALSYPTRYIADEFFSCSEQAGIDRFGKKVVYRSGRHRVFPNAIETKNYAFSEPVRRTVREQLATGDDTFLIGHVGRFDAQKNHTFLLKVFHEVLLAAPNARLLLVGDGKLRERIETQAKTLQIQDSIIFTGVRSDVAELMQAMDVFLFPSLFEGLGIVLIEAQAAGLPCVVSENIPKESALVPELVSVMDLKEPAGKWAAHILSRRGETRTDHSAQVAAAGFDADETAKRLEEYYLDKSRR